MSLKQYLLFGVAAAACLMQAGCGSGQPVDLKYPSVSELDAADVNWGLQPRTGKGAPKRAYQYQIEDSGGGAPVSSAPVAAAPSYVEPQEPANPIPPVPAPQIDVNKLR